MATFNVKVIPNAKQNKIIQSLTGLKVYLSAPAVEGKANQALIEFLSEHYGVKKNGISIKRGMTSRNKVVEIEGL